MEPCEGEPWPVGRGEHAACCLGYTGDHIHLLVTGGRGGDGKVLKDSWLFNLSLKNWKEVRLKIWSGYVLYEPPKWCVQLPYSSVR